jgi:hypothetical protein
VQGATDSRFEVANLDPKVSSKFVSNDCPNFNRYARRELYGIENARIHPIPKAPLPDYNSSKEVILKALTLGGPSDFGK